MNVYLSSYPVNENSPMLYMRYYQVYTNFASYLCCITFVFFSANDNYDKEKEEYYGLTISSNGDVGWFYPTIFKSSCTIDVTYFPFDDQVIRINITIFTVTLYEELLRIFCCDL